MIFIETWVCDHWCHDTTKRTSMVGFYRVYRTNSANRRRFLWAVSSFGAFCPPGTSPFVSEASAGSPYQQRGPLVGGTVTPVRARG